MAVTWGGYAYFGTNNRTRLGIETWYTGDPNSGSVTAWVRYLIETLYSISDDQTLNRTGTITGAHNFYNGGGTFEIVRNSISVSTRYGSSTSYGFGAYLSGHWAGVSPSVSQTLTVPARQYEYPNPPPSVTASRVSDTQINVSWTTNYTGADGPRPWTGVKVERWDVATNTWKQVAQLSWSTTSWSDRTVTSNNRYQYRVRSYNSRGHSSYTSSSRVSTTPAAPSNVVAAKTTSNDIRLTWQNNSRVGTNIRVEASASGAAWTQIATIQPWVGVTSWTHVAPDPTKTWKYRLRHYEADGNLFSPYSAESNTVQVLAPPNAPTGLSPNGQVLTAAEPIILSWQHNPVDTTEQTAYEVRRRVQGTTTWTTTGKVLSASSSVDTSGWSSPFVNGSTYEWQVRTWGAHANPGAWSSTATLPLSERPQALVVFPEDGTTINTPTLTVEWSYFDAEGSTQSSWRARLLDDQGTVIHERSRSGSETQYTFPNLLADGASYTVEITVWDAVRLASPPAPSTFSVQYLPPEIPEPTASWDPEMGAVVVSVVNPPHEEGVTVPAVRNEVWRRIDEGDWVLIASDVPADGSTTDYIPDLARKNEYRVVAWSDLPSAAESDVIVPEGTPPRGGWVFINGGRIFDVGARIRANVTIDPSFGRAKTLVRYAGRTRPVQVTGEQRTRTWTISGKVSPNPDGGATVEDLEFLTDLPGVVCFRDPLGHRWFASMGDVSSSSRGITTTVSIPFEEVDYAE